MFALRRRPWRAAAALLAAEACLALSIGVSPAQGAVATLTVDRIAVAQSLPADTVTYVFEVTNTGPGPLTGLLVTDEDLGAVGTVANLVAGGSVTLRKTYRFTDPRLEGFSG